MVKDKKIIIKFVSGEKIDKGLTDAEYNSFINQWEKSVIHLKEYKFINTSLIEYIKVIGEE